MDPAVFWENLKITLGSTGWTTRVVLHCQLYHAEMQSAQSTARMDDLARKMTDLDGTVLSDELMVVLTNKLPDSYWPLIVSLELVEESKLNVDYVKIGRAHV